MTICAHDLSFQSPDQQLDSNVLFLDLDTLQTLPQSTMPQLRPVTTLGCDIILQSPLSFCVSKRRALTCYTLGDTVEQVKVSVT
jgi:hypothetical protein